MAWTWKRGSRDGLLRAPFPWFGAKARIADVVWRALGDPPNYVEPFGGSLGVLLNRPPAPSGPHKPRVETCNDLDCYVANFFRAAKHAPDDVAEHADWPVNEADLNARHRWLVDRVEFRERMFADPEHFDAKIAGWWLWGICQWIGPNWCEQAFKVRRSAAPSTRYAIERDASGSHAPTWGKFPRRLPHLGNAGMGVHALGIDVRAVMSAIAARLRDVRVACGDWRRVLTPAVTTIHGVTGVFLDPPYAVGEEVEYPVPSSPDLWNDVARWAEEQGENPRLRIVLAGYQGMKGPKGWKRRAWRAFGGYGARGGESGAGAKNAARERLWLSPTCLPLRRGGSDSV